MGGGQVIHGFVDLGKRFRHLYIMGSQLRISCREINNLHFQTICIRKGRRIRGDSGRFARYFHQESR